MLPILYLPCFDFQVHRQRPQQLLYHLSLLGFHVIYCNVTQDQDHPFVKLHDHFIICQDLEAIDQNQEYLMWLTHGPYVDLLPNFKCKMVISDIADTCEEEFAAFKVWQKRKIEVADLVLCASNIIYNETKDEHPQVMLVQNAADYEHFAKAADRQIPLLPFEKEARSLCLSTAPVIGFWGAVASWLDFGLIEYLANERPNYLFVFVGEISCQVPRQLESLPNVRWLGNRDYESLPAFAKQFDAGIIPFQIRKVTEAANPIKLYEYMAAGLPVVSVDLPEARPYPGIRIGKTPAHFLHQLDEALVMDRTAASKAVRQNIARAESWGPRAQAVAEQMMELWMKKSSGTG